MAEQFLIPQEYESSIRRLIPHLAAPLQNNPEVLSSLLLYLKVGGEKLALVTINALNASQRRKDIEMMKMSREDAMSNELRDGENKNNLETSGDGAVVKET